MFCVKCGYELPDYANFCLNCGLPLKEQLSAKQKKRIAIVGIGGNEHSFFLDSTEIDIIGFCKQNYLSLGIKRESKNHHPFATEIPGRFYFYIFPSMLTSYKEQQKIQQLRALVVDMLIRDGWKRDPNGGPYTKDMF